MKANKQRTIAKANEHGRREGAADYRERASEVSRGAESPEHAWPYAGADEAYIKAVGASRICAEIGEEVEWDDIASAWCAAFRAGYEAARESAVVTVTTQVKNPTPTRSGVDGGVDFDVSVEIRDECGNPSWFSGAIVLAPDGINDGLRPIGDRWYHWMSSGLVDMLNTRWIAAHERLVSAIVDSLAAGEGVETFEVSL